jgi:hypothetical protein
MKKIIIVLSLFMMIQSCIPLRIAPNIEDYKLTRGKKFKKSLPKRQMFIFEDPKPANQFYKYINTKFQLQHINVFDDVPFSIAGEQYFFSYYEVDIPDKTINLLPIAVDVALLRADFDPTMEDQYQTRKGNWYIAVEVYSDNENDCLDERSLSSQTVTEFLRLLKNEYLATHNYNEVLFKS